MSEDSSDSSDLREGSSRSASIAVEQIASEVARRIPSPKSHVGCDSASNLAAAPLEDADGLVALLETWPEETLPAALGTVVMLADVAEKNSRRSLSKALMEIAAAAVPRLQALLAAGVVSLDLRPVTGALPAALGQKGLLA